MSDLKSLIAEARLIADEVEINGVDNIEEDHICDYLIKLANALEQCEVSLSSIQEMTHSYRPIKGQFLSPEDGLLQDIYLKAKESRDEQE